MPGTIENVNLFKKITLASEFSIYTMNISYWRLIIHAQDVSNVCSYGQNIIFKQ
jgi:hypothetical protein